MHGHKGGFVNWIIWGAIFTLPMTAIGGIAGLITCWLFFGLMTYYSEKKYHQSGSYIGKQISGGKYAGERGGKIVTINDYPELKRAIDKENYQEELIKEVAIRNAISYLSFEKRTNPICKLAVINSVFPYMRECGCNNKGAYRIVMRKATPNEFKKATENISEFEWNSYSDSRKSIYENIMTEIYY